MNIALIGPSGSGKGIQARKLLKQFNLLHITTGKLLRQNIENRTAVGFLSERYLTEGALVPDEVVDALVAERLWRAELGSGVLINGFPRTVHQAQFLDNHFKELNRTLNAVIYLKVPPAELEKRLLYRVICSKCYSPYHLEKNPPLKHGVCDDCGSPLFKRPDDIPAMLRVRKRAFRSVIHPVLDYYQESGRLIIIDAEAGIEQISADIVKALKTIENKTGSIASKEETEKIKAVDALPVAPVPAKTKTKLFNLILLGAPGSGKGTQAEKLQNAFNFSHISTGDLFRENLKHSTELGLLAKTYMDKGQLVPDEVTEAMVEDHLLNSDLKSGFILDGFPRSLPQAKALTEILQHAGLGLSAVLYIKISDSVIMQRLSGRLVCRDCQTPYHLTFKQPARANTCDTCGGELYQRDDDNPNTIRFRLKTFHHQTIPIVNYYRDAGLLMEINGEADLKIVTENTLAAVKTLRK